MAFSQSIKRIPRWLILISSIFIVLIIGFKSYVYSYHLSFIPEGMRVWKVLYSKEEVWGFGPGGNETGVIVYELPSDVADEVEKNTLDYFSTLPSLQNSRNWRGIYRTWNLTPIEEDWVKDIKKQESTVTPYTTGIANYLDKYGFGIRIDAEVEKSINYAILASGNYYAYGRIGMIIVAPSIRRVFYVYNG